MSRAVKERSGKLAQTRMTVQRVLFIEVRVDKVRHYYCIVRIGPGRTIVIVRIQCFAVPILFWAEVYSTDINWPSFDGPSLWYEGCTSNSYVSSLSVVILS